VFSADGEETSVQGRGPRALLALTLLALAGQSRAADPEPWIAAIEEVQQGAGVPIIVGVAGEGALKRAKKLARQVDPQLVFLRVLVGQESQAQAALQLQMTHFGYRCGLILQADTAEPQPKVLGDCRAFVPAMDAESAPPELPIVEPAPEETEQVQPEAVQEPESPSDSQPPLPPTETGAQAAAGIAGLEEQDVVRRGRAWLPLGGAATMGYNFAFLGRVLKADEQLFWTSLGAQGGGALGFWAGRRWVEDGGSAAFLSSAAVVGTASGSLLGCAVDDDACWAGGLAGQAAGFGLGTLLMRRRPRSQNDTAEALILSASLSLTAGMGYTMVSGMEWFWHPLTWTPTYGSYSEEPAMVATGLGMAGGWALGQVVAPHVDVSGGDIGLMSLSGTWAAVVAGQLEGFPTTGYFAGAGLGTLLGYGLATPLELGGDVVFGGYVGLTSGSLAGLGAAAVVADVRQMSAWSRWALIRASVAAAGTVGMGLGGYVAWLNPVPIRANDVALGAVAAGWAGWQTVGWQTVAGRPASTRGLNTLIPAVVGSAVALTSPRIDVNGERSLGAASLGLWGAYLGAAGADLADTGAGLPAALVLSNIGLGAGALIMSPAVDASPRVVGTATAFGAAGAVTAALLADLSTYGDPVLVASLAGGAAGAMGGGLLGTVLERKDPEGDKRFLLPKPHLELPGTWTLMPATVTDGEITALGAGLRVTGW